VNRITFRVGDRHARPDTRRPFTRSISARHLHHGRHSWTMVARALVRGGTRVRLEKTIHRCG
jgi:hypothetical protein